ncbi:MAG: threonine/serine exporter family protein, partial [Dechloromonas sp.]|nr:threonine/serine exporter family protein [Dechloromonas sp.]
MALHVSGAPAHDLERSLNTIGARLGVRVEGFAVLTFLALTVVAGDGMRRVEMLRLPPYDFNMARLIALQSLSRDIVSADAIDAYAARLDDIMR